MNTTLGLGLFAFRALSEKGKDNPLRPLRFWTELFLLKKQNDCNVDFGFKITGELIRHEDLYQV